METTRHVRLLLSRGGLLGRGGLLSGGLLGWLLVADTACQLTGSSSLLGGGSSLLGRRGLGSSLLSGGLLSSSRLLSSGLLGLLLGSLVLLAGSLLGLGGDLDLARDALGEKENTLVGSALDGVGEVVDVRGRREVNVVLRGEELLDSGARDTRASVLGVSEDSLLRRVSTRSTTTIMVVAKRPVTGSGGRNVRKRQ